LPAVWLLLAALPILAIFLSSDALPRLKEDIPAALLYITNWVYIVREVPYFEAFGRPPLLQHLWSLAVEEQFYLLWPLLLAFLLRALKNKRTALILITAILVILSSIWMAVLFDPEADPLRVYYGTDTRAAGFLVGALLAMIWSPSEPDAGSRKQWQELAGWSGLLALIILYNKLNEFQPLLYRGGILVTALSSALLIVGASRPASLLSKLLETPLLRWIGSRSYSIYLWHWPVLMLTRPGFDLQFPELLIRGGQIALTFGLAELSYRWIETPVRRYGFRQSVRSLRAGFRGWPIPRKLGVGAGILSAGLLVLWQGSIHTVSNQIAVESPISQSTLPVSVTPEMSVASSESSLVNVNQATNESSTLTPTPDLHLPRATLIGDSIMQGAAPMIDDILGRDIYVDAARKRRMEDVPDLIETLYRERHLSHTVVIHLGSNRPFEDAVFDEVMKTLLDHQVERIIFINVRRPIGWEYYINQKFAQDIARWPRAELIDWYALAHTEQGWFIRDQTHLSYYGSKAYVEAIKKQLESAK
jgi:peptidoglycan/LPS O-acetylase OafA/YrhL